MQVIKSVQQGLLPPRLSQHPKVWEFFFCFWPSTSELPMYSHEMFGLQWSLYVQQSHVMMLTTPLMLLFLRAQNEFVSVPLPDGDDVETGATLYQVSTLLLLLRDTEAL